MPLDLHQELQTLRQQCAQLEIALQQRQAQLQRLEQEYSYFFKQAADLWCVVDQDGYFKRTNPTWELMLGYSHDELIEQSILTLIHPADATVMQAAMVSLKAGEEIELNHRYRCKDSSYLLLTCRLVSFGEWIGAVISDIARQRCIEAVRQQTEIELQKREEQLRVTFEQAAIGICHLDLDGHWVLVNQRFCNIVGYTREELLSLTLRDITHADDFHTDLDNLHQLLKGEIPRYSVEKRYIRKNGSIIWINLTIALVRHPCGTPDYFIATMQEVSERKQVEEALLQEQEFTQVVIENVSDGVVACDAQGNLKLFNRASREWHGCDPRSVPPEKWSTLYDLYEADGLTPLRTDRIPLVRAFKGEAVRGASMAIVVKGQSPRYVVASGDPLFDSTGQNIGAVIVMHDVTERRQTEAVLRQSEAKARQQAEQLEAALQELTRTQSQLIQSEKMSSLGQLVAGVAHEINNPVNFIYGNLNHVNDYTQNLLSLLHLYQKHFPVPPSEIDAEMEQMDLAFMVEDLPKILTSMRVGATRIQEIVRSLRNFSRMDEAEFKAVNLHEGIDSTLLILQNRLKNKREQAGIKVIREYGNLPPVECYAGQLNQVFMNILSNAVEALEERDQQRSLEEIKQSPSEIHIKTEVSLDKVKICIRDNGPGIPEKLQSRLFDPFFTTKPVGKGTGLGMSISYQIITEKHKGRLCCFSTLGKGTEFTIEIPLWQP